MAWQENLSEDVREITLYRPLPVYLHGYLVPFLAIYGAVLLGWGQVYGLTEHWEALLISLAALAVLNVLVVLSCVWSVHFRAFLTCKKVRAEANTMQGNVLLIVVPIGEFTGPGQSGEGGTNPKQWSLGTHSSGQTKGREINISTEPLSSSKSCALSTSLDLIS